MLTSKIIIVGFGVAPSVTVDSNDPVTTSFLQRLDNGEMDGRLSLELSKLSYDQLLTVSRILAARHSHKAAEK